MSSSLPLAAPTWATHSVAEDGVVVHERLCSPQPLVADQCPNGLVLHTHPAQVSISVVDVPLDGGWVRREPTIQVEGGSYSVAAALELLAAIREATSAAGPGDTVRPQRRAS